MGIFGPKDNDVRGSAASFGQNRDQDPKRTAREDRGRDGARERAGQEDKKGASRKEFEALAARVANMESFLKEKHQYDPERQYAKTDEKATEAPKVVEMGQTARNENIIARLRAGAMKLTDY